VHTRRISTFLLGGWMGCSFFMAFVVLQNLHTASTLMGSPSVPLASMIKTLGADQMALLLHHQAGEQNRNIMYIWQQAQIVLGLVLGGCLYFATQKRMLSLVLCGIMLSLVLFQFWAVTPEMAYRGRETDFPPGSTTSSVVMRALLLYQMLIVSEVLKLVVGGVLASYLFAFRTSRKRSGRREVESIDDADHGHINRRVRASD
jgi:hypothetical protein